MVIDYSKGKIYKVWSPSTDKVYIGSTCQKLSHRLCGHRAAYRSWVKKKTRIGTVVEIMKYGDARIELIEKVDNCCDKEVLLQREGHYIRTINCVNTQVQGRSVKEYQQMYRRENPEKVKEYQKEYRKANYNRLQQYRKNYRQAKGKIKCECGSEIFALSLKQHQKTTKHQNFVKEKYGTLQ